MPVKAGVIRAGERTTRRGAAETFTGVVFQDPVITAESPSRLGGSGRPVALLKERSESRRQSSHSPANIYGSHPSVLTTANKMPVSGRLTRRGFDNCPVVGA